MKGEWKGEVKKTTSTIHAKQLPLTSIL